jgi:hypothetical protein
LKWFTSLAELIYKVLFNDALRLSLIEKGLERARLFSCGKILQEHIKIFEEVLSS